MEELIKRLERVIQTGAPDKDGLHPIAAEVVLEVVKELTKLGTNLAEVGTDCISRQAVIDAINHELRCGTVIDQCGLETAYDLIEELPSAQPEHIRGHWICDRSWSEGVGMGESYGHYWKCDKCGHLEQGDWGECGCNFCSNCGADMRGEQDG